MLNLHNNSRNSFEFTAFVRMSANWSSDLTYGISTIFASIVSFMKRLSTSTCLVRSCWTGFSEMLMAALLSQNNLHVCDEYMPNSFIILLSHSSSVNPLLIPRNSASALECYHLLLLTSPCHEITSNKGEVPCRWLPIIWISGQIRISKPMNFQVPIFLKQKSMFCRPL